MMIKRFYLILLICNFWGCSGNITMNKENTERKCSKKLEEMKSLNRRKDKAYFIDYKRVYLDCLNRS